MWLQLVVVVDSLPGTCFWDNQGVCGWKDEEFGNAGGTGNPAALSWKMGILSTRLLKKGVVATRQARGRHFISK